MDRLFLDANVLFSAAYREDAGVAVLWSLETASLFSSTYAVEEARRNLVENARQERLERLVRTVQVVQAVTVRGFDPGAIALPDKDRPILAGALEARCTHLLTGDLRHFGRYFGKRVGGILILPPADYIRHASRGR